MASSGSAIITHLPKEDKGKDSPGSWICLASVPDHHVTATETLTTPPTCLSMSDLLYCDGKRMATILNPSSADFY